jgi:hypothetical protein
VQTVNGDRLVNTVTRKFKHEDKDKNFDIAEGGGDLLEVLRPLTHIFPG